MQYLDYPTYGEIGGALDVTAFSRYVDRASGVIDYQTHNRVAGMGSIPKPVQALCRDLVEYYAGHDNTRGNVSSRSQSAGAVSESESYAAADAGEQADEVDRIVTDYLLGVTDDNGTPLLYRGGMID